MTAPKTTPVPGSAWELAGPTDMPRLITVSHISPSGKVMCLVPGHRTPFPLTPSRFYHHYRPARPGPGPVEANQFDMTCGTPTTGRDAQ